jgi:hypothetical protein
MIHHYGDTSHAVFTALVKSLLSSNLEPYEMQYSFINRIRQLVASIQTIGDKRITVLPIAPSHHHHHRLTTRNQCLESLETLPATRSLKASSFMESNTVTCIELTQISECMIAIYDDDDNDDDKLFFYDYQ